MTFAEILMDIEIPDEIGVYEESDDLNSAADYYVGNVLREAELAGLHITYHYGASQLCFIEDGADVVYKIPFDGMTVEWQDFETEEWKESFEHFRTNYTEKTESVYDLAVEAGVEMFFAEIHLHTKSFNHQPIWQQHFVTPRNDQASSRHASEDSMKKAKEMCCPFMEDWLAVAIDMYGEEKLKQLLQFIDDNNLSDFHWGNYGFDREGRPMLLDYAGYDNDLF